MGAPLALWHDAREAAGSEESEEGGASAPEQGRPPGPNRRFMTPRQTALKRPTASNRGKAAAYQRKATLLDPEGRVLKRPRHRNSKGIARPQSVGGSGKARQHRRSGAGREAKDGVLQGSAFEAGCRGGGQGVRHGTRRTKTRGGGLLCARHHQRGGNVKTIGTPVTGKEHWTVGISHPRPEQGQLIAKVSVEGTSSMVTSGDYQRYFHRRRQALPSHHRPADVDAGGAVDIRERPNRRFSWLMCSTAFFIASREEAEQILKNYADTDRRHLGGCLFCGVFNTGVLKNDYSDKRAWEAQVCQSLRPSLFNPTQKSAQNTHKTLHILNKTAYSLRFSRNLIAEHSERKQGVSPCRSLHVLPSQWSITSRTDRSWREGLAGAVLYGKNELQLGRKGWLQ